jgi:hypothetical protein
MTVMDLGLMSRRIVGPFLFAALLLACVVPIAPRLPGPTLAGVTSLQPAHFAAAAGWQVREAGLTPAPGFPPYVARR